VYQLGGIYLNRGGCMCINWGVYPFSALCTLVIALIISFGSSVGDDN
jgi:hypothetical protein